MTSRAPLNVLIVEDNPAKKRKLFEHLELHSDIFGQPEVSVCAQDAIRRLKEKEYDLLILDVFLPLRVEGDPQEQHSIDLLARIDAGTGGVIRPKHVAVISSRNSLSSEAMSFFSGRPWGFIHYEEDSNSSLKDIENVGKWIFKNSFIPTPASKCDIFIIAALEEPEFTALESEFGDLEPLEPLDSSHLIRFCKISSTGGDLRVAIGFASRMGPVASAILATKAIELLRPRLILMSGICGAVASKANIGDLVVADSSWDWQSGKYVNKKGGDFEIAPHQLPMPETFRNFLISLKRDQAFWAQFSSDAQSLKVPSPKLIIGPLATGASVIADERITQKIREEQHKNVVAIDMETYAVYAAAAAASYKVNALSLKAVCDKADVTKNDDFQPYAAKVSSKAVLHLISQYGSKLLNC